MGLFPRSLGSEERFHKELAIHDLYHGGTRSDAPPGPLGSLQQVATPPLGLLQRELPAALTPAAGPLRDRLTGLLVMAEDQPRAHNRARAERAPDGSPRLVVEHRHSSRDMAARRRLVAVAKRVLHRAGAAYCYVHPIATFSHALGTVRMGPDPRFSPLDGNGGYRGIDNLFVVDGSALPRAGAVNPSLTIAAHGLRAGAGALGLQDDRGLLAAA